VTAPQCGSPAPEGAFDAHGWTVYLHPLFQAQLDRLQNSVEALRRKEPLKYRNHATAKRLVALLRLVSDIIPQDPTRPEYRQGAALGEEHRHWFRAKFFQQYRLFFRYHTGRKIIVFAWVNDAQTKRAYESDDDAYRVFRKMLLQGHPPDDWEALIRDFNDGPLAQA